MTALAILGLLPPAAKIDGGRIELEGEDLLQFDDAQMRSVRGNRVAMVFQEPMTALNPVLTIGFQIIEAIRAHSNLNRAQAQKRAEELLERVAIPTPAQRLKDYPHQLSGGQRQRAMIAMALAADPQLLIADEPTTALDVTIQAQILELLQELRDELGLTVLLITHDLGVVAETCDRALVMYGGRIVEEAPVGELFATPAHPYTRGLLASQPSFEEGEIGAELPTIEGQTPDPARMPGGCSFHPRCGEVMDDCSIADPGLTRIGDHRKVACHLYEQETAHAAG
jgi:oligopeptide/dipeptide ABC transporter ATP-binding protein